MPRNVRNFWIELNVDGSKTAVETGPRNRDGGFSMTIQVRRNGEPAVAMQIAGRVGPDGKLQLIARNEIDGGQPLAIEVAR